MQKESDERGLLFMKKKIITHLLLAGLAIGLIAAPAVQTPAASAKKPSGVKISAKNFPDEYFRGYVRKKFDTNKNGYLSSSELKKAKIISINYHVVDSFKGLEYFKNLTKFSYCADDDMEKKGGEKHFDFTDCKNIAYVGIASNKTKSVNVKNCKKLKYLECSGYAAHEDEKNLKSVRLSGCTKLQHLDIWNSTITKLDLSGSKELKEVSVLHTNLKTLNIAGCRKLTRLSLSDTKLKKLDVSKMKKMKYLSCANSRVEKIDLAHMKNLRLIDLSGNRKMKSVNLKNNKKLETVMLSNTAISKLDMSESTVKRLCELEISGTNISKLNLKGCTKMEILYCSNTKIKTLNLTELPKLRELECENLGLRKLDLTKNPKLLHLQCRGNAFTTLDLSKCSEIEKGSRGSRAFRVDKKVNVKYSGSD